jgi:glutaconate CoA-transferase subunit A
MPEQIRQNVVATPPFHQTDGWFGSVRPVKVMTLPEAVELVPDGASIGTGGILMTRKPVALLDAIARVRKDLRLWTLLGSVDAELLAVHGALAESNTIYVGFEQLGFAPAYTQAVDEGAVDAREYSELLMLAGLRASLAGLPFLPTRGAQGSDVAAALEMKTITCPYTGDELFAAPAIRPDVALVHAETADLHGNVAGPRHRDFLFDWDANIARASSRVIVSVERVVARVEDALLFAHEVDAIVELPGGAKPTALPGAYAADLAQVGAYVRGEGPLT